MRRTPQSAQLVGIARQLAAIGGEGQLFQRARLQMAGSCSTRHKILRRTSGSPPVSLSLRTPRRMKAVATRSSLLEGQNLLFRQKGHVFRHAIDAAEVAAVGHRDPQIGDMPAERIDQLGVRNGGKTGLLRHDGGHALNFGSVAGCVKCRSWPRARHGKLAPMQLLRLVQAALRRIALCLSLGLALGPTARPPDAAAAEKVDLALVLAVDCSYSVDASEFRLQIKGLADAFRRSDIHDAITAGASRRIAVTLMQWSDDKNQLLALPWTVLDSPAAAENFADKVGRLRRGLAEGGTAIGDALRFAAAVLMASPMPPSGGSSISPPTGATTGAIW